MTASIRVFMADDDADFRRVYRKLFQRSDGFELVGEAGSGVEALRKILSLTPDVVLLDVQMPGIDGLNVIKSLANSGIKIIVLTAFDLDEYVYVALHHGAAGFLLKNASSTEVLAAVRAVHAGHGSLAPEITGRLIDQFNPSPDAVRHPFAGKHLSNRELEVIKLVAQGKTNKQIADELFLSSETVRTYLKRMFIKFDVKHRTELAMLAYQAGLLNKKR